MPEPVFLLILMAVTGLGVWTFLSQFHSGRLALPRIGLPRLALPTLPARGRRRRGRSRRLRPDDRFEYEDDDAGVFAPALSTFQPDTAYLDPALGSPAMAQPQLEYEDDEYDLLPNQVDFFAPDEPERPRPSPAPATGASGYAAGFEATEAEPSVVAIAEPPEAAGTFQVAVDPDPNDIMSFFDKPAATTQLPETLRESLETVSASELLLEARQLRALLQGRRDAA